MAKKSKIRIKKANRGKFTAKAKAAGMSVQEYAAHVLSKNSRASAATKKQANFARNAAKWKRHDGGFAMSQGLDAFYPTTPTASQRAVWAKQRQAMPQQMPDGGEPDPYTWGNFNYLDPNIGDYDVQIAGQNRELTQAQIDRAISQRKLRDEFQTTVQPELEGLLDMMANPGMPKMQMPRTVNQSLGYYQGGGRVPPRPAGNNPSTYYGPQGGNTQPTPPETPGMPAGWNSLSAQEKHHHPWMRYVDEEGVTQNYDFNLWRAQNTSPFLNSGGLSDLASILMPLLSNFQEGGAVPPGQVMYGKYDVDLSQTAPTIPQAETEIHDMPARYAFISKETNPSIYRPQAFQVGGGIMTPESYRRAEKTVDRYANPEPGVYRDYGDPWEYRKNEKGQWQTRRIGNDRWITAKGKALDAIKNRYESSEKSQPAESSKKSAPKKSAPKKTESKNTESKNTESKNTESKNTESTETQAKAPLPRRRGYTGIPFKKLIQKEVEKAVEFKRKNPDATEKELKEYLNTLDDEVFGPYDDRLDMIRESGLGLPVQAVPEPQSPARDNTQLRQLPVAPQNLQSMSAPFSAGMRSQLPAIPAPTLHSYGPYMLPEAYVNPYLPNAPVGVMSGYDPTIPQPTAMFQEGGPVEEPELTPIQAEKGEKILFPDGMITNVLANKRHEQMDDEDVTDVLPPQSFIASTRPNMKIRKDEAERALVGITPVIYEEGKQGSPPEEITMASLMTSSSMTPAEYSAAIQRRYPLTKRMDDPFSQLARDENKASRIPYIQGVRYFTEQKKDDQGISTPQYAYGGMTKGPQKAFPGLLIGGIMGALGIAGGIFRGVSGAKAAEKRAAENERTLQQAYERQLGYLSQGTGAQAAGLTLSTLRSNQFVAAPNNRPVLSTLQAMPAQMPPGMREAALASQDRAAAALPLAMQQVDPRMMAYTGTGHANNLYSRSALAHQILNQDIGMRMNKLQNLGQFYAQDAAARTQARNATNANLNQMNTQFYQGLGNIAVNAANQQAMLDDARTKALIANQTNLGNEKNAAWSDAANIMSSGVGFMGTAMGFQNRDKWKPSGVNGADGLTMDSPAVRGLLPQTDFDFSTPNFYPITPGLQSSFIPDPSIGNLFD